MDGITRPIPDRLQDLNWSGTPVAGDVPQYDGTLFAPVKLGDTVKHSFTFSWGDATPRTLFTALAGKKVLLIVLYMTVAFDGINAALSLGDAGDVERLMAASHNIPSVLGSYATRPNYAYGSDTAVTLSITPGSGASAGSGLVVVEVQR